MPLLVKLGKIGLRRAVVLNALETELTEPVSNPEQGESQGGGHSRGAMKRRPRAMKARFEQAFAFAFGLKPQANVNLTCC